MARRDVTITGQFDSADWVNQITRSTQKAQRAMPKLRPQVDERGLRPLGKMMGSIQRDASEFDKSMEAANARVIAFAGSTGIIFGLTRAFRGLVRTTADLQANLTDIQTILQATPRQMRQFGREIFTIARQTGQSFNVAADAAREFARQGLAMDETLRRVNDALVLVRVSNMQATTAVEGLTAAINAFSDEAITSTRILNTLVAVETQFAVASNDLIQAIRNAGAIAGDAGVSFNELTAAVTTARQITARTGSDIGNAFRTIFTRVQRQATLEALRDLGIETERLDGSLRGTMDILRDVARAYDDLGDVQAAYIAELVGGVFNINILRATLNDLNREFSIYDNALNVATNATDEAIRRNERLNRTLTSLANEGMQRIVELSGAIGEEMIVAPFERGLVRINRLLEGLGGVIGGEDEGEEEGFSFARGFLRGLGNVLSGPGVAAAFVAISRVVWQTLKFAEVALAKLLGIGSAIERQRADQEMITRILAAHGTSYEQILAKSRSREEAERRVLSIIKQQAAALRVAGAAHADLAGVPAIRGALGRVRGTLAQQKATDFVPRPRGALYDREVGNFANRGVGQAIQRETQSLQARGMSPGQAQRQIFVGSDPRTGVAVGNFVDEPSGRISQGVNREIRRGNNPRGFGNFSDFIPNFASVAHLTDAQVMALLNRHAPAESMRKIQQGQSPRRVLSGLAASFRHPQLKAGIELMKGGPRIVDAEGRQQLGVAPQARIDPRLHRTPPQAEIGRGFTSPFARGRSPLEMIRASGTMRSIHFERALREVRQQEAVQQRIIGQLTGIRPAQQLALGPGPGGFGGPGTRVHHPLPPDPFSGPSPRQQERFQALRAARREARTAALRRAADRRFERISQRMEEGRHINVQDRRFFERETIRRATGEAIEQRGLDPTRERRRAFRRQIAPEVRGDLERRRQEIDAGRERKKREARAARESARRTQMLEREQRFAGRIMMGGIGMSMLAGMLEGTPAGRIAPMLQMAGTGAFMGSMFGGVPGAAVGAGIGGTIGGIQALTSDLGIDVEELNQAYLKHQSTIKETVNATGEFIRAQEAFNNAVRDGDEMEMRRLSGELSSLLSNIGDAGMRRNLINAAGDLEEMQNALSKFSVEAQEQQRRLGFMADIGRTFEESDARLRRGLQAPGFQGGLTRFLRWSPFGQPDDLEASQIQNLGQGFVQALNVFEESDETINSLRRTIFDFANQGKIADEEFSKLLQSFGLTRQEAGKVANTLFSLEDRLVFLQSVLDTTLDVQEIIRIQKETERLRVTQQNFTNTLREQDQLLRFRGGIDRLRRRTDRDIAFEGIEGRLELGREFLPQGIADQAGQRLERARINEEFLRGVEDSNIAAVEKFADFLDDSDLNLSPQRTAETLERLRKDASQIGNVLAEILKDINDESKEIRGGTTGVTRELQNQQLEIKQNHAELMEENRKANSFLDIQNQLTRELTRIERVRRDAFGMGVGQAFLDPEMRRDLGASMREMARESARVITHRDPRVATERQLGQTLRLGQMFADSPFDMPQGMQQMVALAQQELQNRLAVNFARQHIQASGLGGHLAPGGAIHRMFGGRLGQAVRERDPEALRGMVEQIRERAPGHSRGDQLNRLASILEIVASEFEAIGTRDEMLEAFKSIEDANAKLVELEQENHKESQNKRDDIISAINRLAPEEGTTERMRSLQEAIERQTAVLIRERALEEARGERGRLSQQIQAREEELARLRPDERRELKLEEKASDLISSMDESRQVIDRLREIDPTRFVEIKRFEKRLQDLQQRFLEVTRELFDLRPGSQEQEEIKQLREELKELRKERAISEEEVQRIRESFKEALDDGGEGLAEKLSATFENLEISVAQKFEDAIRVDVIDDEEKQSRFLAKLVQGVANELRNEFGETVETPDFVQPPRRSTKRVDIRV